MFSDVTFHPETVFTNMTYTPNPYDYLCDKDS